MRRRAPRTASPRQAQQRHRPGDDEEDQVQAHKPKIIARQPEPELPAGTVRVTEPTASRKASAQVAQVSALTGHRRIQGEPARRGHAIAASTVQEILHAAGIDPAPRRDGPTWRQFLAAQAHAIIACDFLVAETVPLNRLHVLAFIEHGTRRLHLARVTARPIGPGRPSRPATSPWT
jgi:hypothetical protein